MILELIKESNKIQVTRKYKITDKIVAEGSVLCKQSKIEKYFAKSKFTLDLIKKQRGFHVFALTNPDEFYKKLKTHTFYDNCEITGDYWFKSLGTHHLTLDDLSTGKFEFVLVNYNNHSFCDLQGDKIPCLLRFSYIYGIQQERDEKGNYKWHWEKLKKYLNSRKYIKIKEEYIPGYNADFSGQKAFVMDIYCHNKKSIFYKKFLNLDNHTRISNSNFDLLGISRFINPEYKGL